MLKVKTVKLNKTLHKFNCTDAAFLFPTLKFSFDQVISFNYCQQSKNELLFLRLGCTTKIPFMV